MPNSPEVMRHSRERACERIGSGLQIVAPAKAGVQSKRLKSLDSRLRGNDEMSDAGFILTISSHTRKRESRAARPLRSPWTPAFAGVTGNTLTLPASFRVGH